MSTSSFTSTAYSSLLPAENLKAIEQRLKLAREANSTLQTKLSETTDDQERLNLQKRYMRESNNCMRTVAELSGDTALLKATEDSERSMEATFALSQKTIDGSIALAAEKAKRAAK